MANFRQLHTRIWSDAWFVNLSNEQKLFFIYLFGNPRASVTGLYELPLKVMSFETGLDRSIILKAFDVYTAAGKVYYDRDAEVVWVVNMPKYQLGERVNVTLQKRIEADISAVPVCKLKSRFLEKKKKEERKQKKKEMGHACPSDGVNSISPQSESQSESQSQSLEEVGVPPAEERGAGGEGKPADIFRVYEQNIGALTPLIAEALRDAERSDGAAWVCAAIDEAVKNNARAWKYCESILRRWRRDGFRVDTKPRSRADGKLTPEQLQTWAEDHPKTEA